jgi:hypothetical protein
MTTSQQFQPKHKQMKTACHQQNVLSLAVSVFALPSRESYVTPPLLTAAGLNTSF